MVYATPMQLELWRLRYFVCAAETLNFRSAAERLHVSAPALSKQIRILEESVGVRLFDRESAKVRLTNPGGVLLSEAKDLLARAQRAAALTQEATRGYRGRLIVGNVGPVMSEYLPACLTAFASRYPDVRVELSDVSQAEQISTIEKGVIDLGFISVSNAFPLPPRLDHGQVLSVPVFAVLGCRHPLAKQGSVSLADLVKERLLFVREGSASFHGKTVGDIMARRGFSLGETQEVVGRVSVFAMIASGQGVTLMAFGNRRPREHKLALLPLKETGPDLTVDFLAIWRKAETSALVPNFVKVLKEVGARWQCRTVKTR